MEMKTAKQIAEHTSNAFNGMNQASTGATGAERAMGLAKTGMAIAEAVGAMMA